MIGSKKKAPKGVPQIAKMGSIPVPIGGINSAVGLADMSPTDSVYSYNLIPTVAGLKVRSGYNEWSTNVAGAGGVRTMMSVKSQNATGGSQDRLFACTITGIYEVTSGGNAPTLVVTFGTQTGDAGYGYYHNTTTTAGQFTCYYDEVNGMYTYAVATNTWLKVTLGAGAGQISGVDPATLVFGVTHKGRQWLVEKNSSRAWYLAPGAVYGAATLFELGNKFLKGGYLVGIYLYTVNGTNGPISFLVFLSSAGDVSIWQGNDPAAATTWDSIGCFYVGDLPLGRNVANSFNGELVIISIYGIIPVSKLITGLTLDDAKINYTNKISNLINPNLSATRASRGWEIASVPQQNLILIASPKQTGQPYIQYCQNLSTLGWTVYRNIPYQCSAVFNGNLYFGTSDNRVCIHQGDVDNTSLTGTNSVNITWSLLTAFAKSDPVMKIPSFLRTYFISMQPVSYDVKVYFDYNIVENLTTVSSGGFSGSVWDGSNWDSAIWGGGTTPANSIEGLSGIGVNMAVALRGSSNSSTTCIGFEAVWREGGYM